MMDDIDTHYACKIDDTANFRFYVLVYVIIDIIARCCQIDRNMEYGKACLKEEIITHDACKIDDTAIFYLYN